MCLQRTFDISLAAFGQECLEKAKAEKPDLILLDVNMPDLDGPETLALLGQNENIKDIPVVFLTGSVQAEEKESYKKLRAVGTISKPFDPLLLADEIHSYLR